MMNQYDFNCFRIVIIKEVECKDFDDQRRQEQEMIDDLKPKLNKNSAYGNKCEHNVIRWNCKLCKGSQICEHSNFKYTCKLCGGNQICQHIISKCDVKFVVEVEFVSII